MIKVVGMDHYETPYAATIEGSKIGDMKHAYTMIWSFMGRPQMMSHLGKFYGALAVTSKFFPVGDDTDSDKCYEKLSKAPRMLSVTESHQIHLKKYNEHQ